MNIKFNYLIILILFGFESVSVALPSRAEEGNCGTAISVRWENDAFGGTDANYTNGSSLALNLSGQGLAGGIWNLFNHPDGRRSSAYELVQLQFTPDDLGRRNPDPNDRPYAGVLYLGLTTFLERENSLHGLKIFFGVVGPASLSEVLQKTTHRTIGYHLPQGWDYQLKNEPIVNLLYEYRQRIRFTSRDRAFGFEVLPKGDIMLGNYLTEADAGTEFRIGYQIPDDFGDTTLRGIGVLPVQNFAGLKRKWGFYVFAGGAISIIGRDITLDGNTWATSRNVDKRPIVPSAEFGTAIWTGEFRTTFSYVMLGKEFYGQKIREDFGSVLLTLFF